MPNSLRWSRLEWAPRYMISENGDIQDVSGYMLKPTVMTSGHLRLWVQTTDGFRAKLVHRLVCEAFHGPAPEGKPLVLHWDDDPSNNHYSNLRWGSYADNRNDAVRNGGDYNARRTHCINGHSFQLYAVRNPKGHRVCVLCRRASDAATAQVKRERGLPEGDPRHGTSNGRLNYGCKCDPCMIAGREYARVRRAEKAMKLAEKEDK